MADETPAAALVAKRAADAAASALVDESTYETALRLSRLATTTEEQPYALTALRVADHALALAFTTALRDGRPIRLRSAQRPYRYRIDCGNHRC